MSAPSAPAPPCPPLPRHPSRGSVRRRPAHAALLLVAALLVVLVLPGRAQAEGARWQWPVPPPHPVLSPFEEPEHRYGPGHRGIDVAVAAEGAAVRAVETGTVRFSGSVAGRGVVSVVHADGLVSTYEPVEGVLEEGSSVEAGEVLGTLARSSASSHCPGSVCLHLGARRGDAYLDPLPLLGAHGPSVLLPWGGVAAGVVPSAAAGAVPYGADPLRRSAARAIGAALAGRLPSLAAAARP